MAFARGKLNQLESLIGDIGIEYQALSYYFGINKLPCLINSPIRLDHSPSFYIYSSSKGRVKWKDYGSGEFGDIWNLLARYWKCSITMAEERVERDLTKLSEHRSYIKVIPTTSVKKKLVHNSEVDLQVKVRTWRSYDLEYWQSQGISKRWLQFGDIYPISHIFIKRDFSVLTIPAEKYSYVFVEFKDGNPSLKIYQPFSKKYKWTNKHDASVWDLWTKLPETGDSLIITSSRKDALCIWENTGIPATGLQGEGYLPKERVMLELKRRFKRIFVLYDNDFRSETNFGREYGKRLAQKFDLEQIEIPTYYHSKDPSDLYHNCGATTLRETIFNLTKQKEITPF